MKETEERREEGRKEYLGWRKKKPEGHVDDHRMFFLLLLLFRFLCFPYYNHNLETMKHQHLPPSVDDEDEKFPFSEPYQERPSCDYDYDTMVLGVLHLLSGIDLIPLYFIFLFKKDLFLRYPRTYLLSGII